MPHESLKPLVVISVTLIWTALILLVTKWPRDRRLTFSKHAAQYRETYFMMAIVQSIVLPLFFVFAAWWFVPTFHLPVIYTVAAGLSSLGLLMAAWVPDVKGAKGKFHQISAYSAYILIILLSLIQAFSHYIPLTARVFSAIIFPYYVVTTSLMLIHKRSATYMRKYYLYIQASYIATFHISLLLATYLK
jgi:hypothetical protein